MSVRLILAPLAALLLAPLLPGVPALAATDTGSGSGPVQVTALVRHADGKLSVRHGRARDTAAGGRLARSWRGQGSVVAADVARRIHVTGTVDPLEGRQWGLTTLRAPEVWATGDASGQVVAVIDTGVDAGHPDLAGVVLPGTDVVAPGGDGRIDPNGHGTHVAGIVGAVQGNGIGGAGLAKGAKILPVRVMGADGNGWDYDAAQGLLWAADHGATVANLSFGGTEYSSVMAAAISYALGKGVSVVVSSGNSGLEGDPVLWPAADPGVIAVGAVDSAGARPGWSSTGNHLAVTAPGVGIISTVPGGRYGSWSGTSMAAPFVAAAAALLRHDRPGLTPADVRTRLMMTAADLGPTGFDPQYGAGRVDVLAAEAADTTGTVPPTATGGANPAPVAVPAPVPTLTARISASRTSIPVRGLVTVSARVLQNGKPAASKATGLQVRSGGAWVAIRYGASNRSGLISWALRPDRTTEYRYFGTGWVSPTVRVTVVAKAARR
jgi:serine protease